MWIHGMPIFTKSSWHRVATQVALRWINSRNKWILFVRKSCICNNSIQSSFISHWKPVQSVHTISWEISSIFDEWKFSHWFQCTEFEVTNKKKKIIFVIENEFPSPWNKWYSFVRMNDRNKCIFSLKGNKLTLNMCVQ